MPPASQSITTLTMLPSVFLRWGAAWWEQAMTPMTLTWAILFQRVQSGSLKSNTGGG